MQNGCLTALVYTSFRLTYFVEAVWHTTYSY